MPKKKAATPKGESTALSADPAVALADDAVVAVKPHRWRRLFHKGARMLVSSSLPESMLTATFLLSRYVTNSDFSRPSEVIFPIVMFTVLNTFFFYVYKLILRSNLAAHAATLPLGYALYAYTYTFPRLHHAAAVLTPNRFETPFTLSVTTTLILAFVFGMLAFMFTYVVTHIKQLRGLPLLKITVFAICFIFVVQLYKVGTRLWTIRHELTYHGNHQALQPAKAASSKPNMYYFVFDRYASAQTLKDDYHFDNSGMLDFLSQQGFVTRNKDAYANYPFTPQSVSSTMNMQYHTSLNSLFKNDAPHFQTAFPYRDILDDSALSKTLKSQGYTYNQVSSWWDFTRNNPTADNEPNIAYRLRILGKQFFMTDLQRDLINKSVFSPLLLKGLTINNHAVIKYDRDFSPPQNFETEIADLKGIAAASSHQTKPQFTFAHFLAPHDPYVFNKDGSTPTYSSDRTDDGADETVKYTNQLTYVNIRYQDLLATLRQKDPNAVIVIQADEGPYPKQFRGELSPNHYYDPKDLPLQQMRQKFGIMASYYLPGVDKTTAVTNMDSSVNTFRFILNQYLGYNLPMLPDCQFTAGNKFTMFDFTSVGGKLRGTAEPEACKQLQ